MTLIQVIAVAATCIGSIVGPTPQSPVNFFILKLHRIRWRLVLIIALFLIQFFSTSASAQAGEFEIGDEVVVATEGNNLNLRGGAGLSYPIVAKLPNGTVVKVIGGPENAEGYEWWEIDGKLGRGWVAGKFLRPISGNVPKNSESSEEGKENQQVDWRRYLECPPDREIYQGMEYCEGIDDIGIPIHVLVVDLNSPDIALEYILPKGYSKGHDGLQPCHDPNVPAWAGPAGGCYVDGNPSKYPTLSIYEAVERAREERVFPQPVAIINADYGAPNETHGPEGFMVIKGERYDGADKCDDDYNAALRPWLGVSENIETSAGKLLVTIDRLNNDLDNSPDWIYTGIGGGPWLIREGQLVPGSTQCRGDKALQLLEPIENCTGNTKSPKTAPLQESYADGSCRSAPHTAVGISKDNRWLFFVVSTSNRNPNTISNFMLEKLGVWNGMKFDGGGSSQMLFLGQPEILVYPENVGRNLTNFLALYAPQGKGINLPLEAEPTERVYYTVVVEGETAQVQLEVMNSGVFTWNSEDSVELREEPWFLLSPVVESLPLPKIIMPREIAKWDWKINTNGVLVQRFQMYQKDEPFGSEFAVIVVVVPKEMTDKREEIEQKIKEMIDEWKARGERELSELIQQIVDWAVKEINNWLWEICNGVFGGIGFLAAFLFFSSIQRYYHLQNRDT